MGCNSSSTAVGPLNGVNEDAVSNAAESGPTPASSAASRATCVRCKAKEADDGDVVEEEEAAGPVDENGEALPPPRASREVREVPDGEDEEAVDIDLEDPELEQAATRIQAAFRGHRARQQQEPSQEADAPAAPAAPAATMASDEPTKEQLEADFDPNDKDLCNAATKIQASFRGHVARKAVPGKVDEEITKKMADLDTKDDAEAKAKQALENELADIDLTDPDLHRAASKIQASFRGHKVRREGEGEAEAGHP